LVKVELYCDEACSMFSRMADMLGKEWTL
jgi:hypothetical protein